MGIVYLCFDHEDQRPVALKTFKPEYLPDRAARDRFLREGTTWVNLGRHPHIVRAYGVERVGDGREVYLVLELVAEEQGREDASLRSWLTPGQPLPVETALLFALQIARGMAHAAVTIPGFVHRDLKPENVLVGADWLAGKGVNRLRVTDFGLVKVVAESQVASITGMGKADLGQVQFTRGAGTPLYMAPEQWRGEAVTVATDVYALGCILVEMLAGRRPVEGHSLKELERAHCAGDLRPIPAGLPGDVRALLARCLAMDAGERYSDWDAVEAALVAAYEQAAGLPAILGGLEEHLNLFLGERFNRCLFEPRGRHALHRIGDAKLVAGPAEEGRQSHPEVADGLGREGSVAAAQATGCVVGAQPGQEGAQVLCRYPADVDITDVFLPQLEVI
jgi:serine/threonine protein kinase